MLPRPKLPKPRLPIPRLHHNGSNGSADDGVKDVALTDIVLDAMGSDKAPEPEIRGAILACREHAVRVHLVGPEATLRAILDDYLNGETLPIHIVNATERIGMDEKAAVAVRNKMDSSMRVGLKMVKERRAAGFLTAGNTGAAMATAKMVLRALPGVDRPALTAILPTSSGSPCVLLDVGANVECKPQNLEQFAVMGEMYSRSVLKIARPRIGLLSIGEEESKGNELTREAYGLLKQLPINFIGNVEGRDIFNGNADVIVCDGFVGNVALKTSEGLARLVSEMLRESLTRTVTAQAGALLSRKALKEFKKRLDYREYGGAPLLGVRGVCIVGHGSSNDRAIMNGIRVAAEFAQARINDRIEQEFVGRPAVPPADEGVRLLLQ
jgi:glycerol-3-phosphate acyltransferase PlsX